MLERNRRPPWYIPLTLCALGCAAFAIDLPAARWCRPDPVTGHSRVPGMVRKTVSLAEVFAHGIGAAAIVLSVLVLDPGQCRTIPRLFGAALGAGLVADLAKWLVIARYRPAAANLDGTVRETFIAWLPFWSEHFSQQKYRSAFQSFPSAHSAVAAGLAVGLAILYPRGRWWFALLALLSLLQRIEAGAHFPSDTLFGAALGFCIGRLCFRTYQTGSELAAP